ncbi:hypothetical protein HDV63DRAFT_361363 [Trichoderma sp. SZMC 28014]
MRRIKQLVQKKKGTCCLSATGTSSNEHRGPNTKYRNYHGNAALFRESNSFQCHLFIYFFVHRMLIHKRLLKDENAQIEKEAVYVISASLFLSPLSLITDRGSMISNQYCWRKRDGSALHHSNPTFSVASPHPLRGDKGLSFLVLVPILSYTISIFLRHAQPPSLSYLMADRCGGVA